MSACAGSTEAAAPVRHRAPLGRPRRGDRPDRPQGLPAPAQRRSLASARAGRCWPCCSSAAVSASVWLVFFSSYVTAAGRRGHRHRRRSATAASSAPPRCRSARRCARVDLDAIRARVESIAAGEDRRGVPRLAAPRAHRRHRAHARSPWSTRGEGLQALDDDGVLFRHYDDAARGARRWSRHRPDTTDEALVEAGRVIGSLPVGPRRRVDTVEVASVDEIELVLGNGRRRAVGERGGLRARRPRCSPCCCKRPAQRRST